jgi:hypothetical protein
MSFSSCTQVLYMWIRPSNVTMSKAQEPQDIIQHDWRLLQNGVFYAVRIDSVHIKEYMKLAASRVCRANMGR